MSEHDNHLEISADKITKRFGYRTIFKNLSFDLKSRGAIALTGPNGSGKSTLLKIAAGITSPASGNINFNLNGRIILREELYKSIGYLGPDVNPYEELTAIENISFALRRRGYEPEHFERADYLLDKLGINRHRDSYVKIFSSGMRQRLKFILAVINDPPALFFDEPGMNLDADGKDAVYSIIETLAEKKNVVIAANEPSEIALCSGRISLV